MNDLSMKIVYYKKKFKMTNKILAEKTGLPVGTISRIASGETKEPTLKTLRLIANAFGCTVDDLQVDSTESSSLNKDTIQMAQMIQDNPEYKFLFDSVLDLPDDDIKMLVQVANHIKNHL
jgi:transcriptional regulator with XRE-family HTH domain